MIASVPVHCFSISFTQITSYKGYFHFVYFLFLTLNHKQDGAILCILNKRCLNEATFHETEVWFAVRDNQNTKQVTFIIFIFSVHPYHKYGCTLSKPHHTSEIYRTQTAVSPTLNWMKRQYFCQTKGQESD